MSFVAVDLGASSTRFISNKGVISTIPNNTVFLGVDEEIDLEAHNDEIDNALEIVIRKKGTEDEVLEDGEESIFPVRVLIGTMAERYSSINERPSVMLNKHKQRVNYTSAIASAVISKIRHQLEGDLDLYVALPPIEVLDAKDIVGKELLGEYEISLPKYLGGLEMELSIGSVTCLPESSMAMLSFMFSMEGKPREDIAKYQSGNILSMDIGASTTDLAILKNGVYLDVSGQTYKTGGNVARDYLMNKVRAKYGYDLPIGEAESTIAEGRLQLGSGYEIVGDVVSEAKSVFANSVVEQMQNYFRQVNIPIQAIKYIIVSGGGSMASKYIDEKGEEVETSKPMSEYITEAIQKVCKGVEVVHYGDEPRTANIKGMFIKASVDAKKKEASKK